MNPFRLLKLGPVCSGAALLALSWVGILPAAAESDSASLSPIDFQRDVRPILSSHCFKCHGPDEQARKARLRLDLRENATAPARSGETALVPGKPDQSELIRRIFSTDESEIMPPPETKHPLSLEQLNILKSWVESGADYSPHWAFLPPKQEAPPKVRQPDWPSNAIDHFVLARLEKEGLQPSQASDRHVLARRLYLDLIGLPPTPEETEAFLRDDSPEAYEKLVDLLLASPHYGERWARRWLDLARYADTNGYEKDRQRSIWPYRDWVINALNADMPFDQFTLEQIAGDMLPDPSPDQLVATGFHRNTMLNEEGGIDPLEYRFYAMVDRVHVTSTAWLGLTMACAQCHTHKYDPITHQEYYQFMAFLNNADEPELDVHNPEIEAHRAEVEQQINKLQSTLPDRFPPAPQISWHAPDSQTFASEIGADAKFLPDRSFLVSGAAQDKDVYTILLESNLPNITAVRLEALADPALPNSGPGRAPHGNFVLNEIEVAVAPANAPHDIQKLNLTNAQADFAQSGFPAAHAIDGKSNTGWAIHGPDRWNVDRTAIFSLEKPVAIPEGGRWTIRLSQQHGGAHLIGKFRLSLGHETPDDRPLAERRREHLEERFAEWLERERGRVVRWTPLRPVEAKSNLPFLTIQEDDSVFVSGDQSKSDTYELKFRPDLRGITALRLEALPDERLPRHGPGRIYYEGPFGDFWLSEIILSSSGSPIKIQQATHSFANGNNGAPATLDGDPQTGWSINGRQGEAHHAVFNLAEPLRENSELELKMLFERYYAANLGRFRISATTDPRPAEALDLPGGIQQILLLAPGELSIEQERELLHAFLERAPELAPERQEIENLRKQKPRLPTTLIMAERPPENPRPTTMHHRGEFLQPTLEVNAAVPEVLHPFPAHAPKDRLHFARWLVSPENPLVGRVVMNRHWAAFFGTGLVRTLDDFGFQGELPSHPELLDWLALEWIHQGWSIKAMHRLIVTSATYQQSSAISTELLAKDPQNRLLARGPRARLEAELIRDSALRLSGLLVPKLGGPSVFPPQPGGVTTEGTYGPLQWKVSEGDDRYRRGLYTFMKRTAPYAMFTTFDGPTGEACLPRREVSNTPLQSLTLLNDPVFMETAQTLGRSAAALDGSDESRAVELFQRVLSRPPEQAELTMILEFFLTQKARLASGDLNPSAILGAGEDATLERAAWTLVARALLNLDEAITKS
jgi:hypothetical protein